MQAEFNTKIDTLREEVKNLESMGFDKLLEHGLAQEAQNWPNIDWQEKMGDFTGPQKYC